MREVGMLQGIVLKTAVCPEALRMTGTVDHERRIRGEHKYEKQNQQPDNEARSLWMSI
jgi:hypothetical protein